MGRVYAIAINTFREAVRDRVLYGVLGFASAVLLFTLALGELSLDQQRRVVYDVGFASISLFSVIVAVFLGSSLLYKEIERKTLYVILPKPIRRHEFLLGKYLGITLTGAVFIALLGAIQLVVMAVQAEAPPVRIAGLLVALAAFAGVALHLSRDRTAVLLPFSAVALAGAAGLCASASVEVVTPLSTLLLSTGEVMVLAAVALLFSSFSTPFLTGVFTLGVWVVGRSADDMVTMQGQVLSDSIKTVLRFVAEVVPNLNLFVPGRHALVEMATERGDLGVYLGTTLGHALLYSALALGLGALIFRRRDFL